MRQHLTGASKSWPAHSLPCRFARHLQTFQRRGPGVLPLRWADREGISPSLVYSSARAARSRALSLSSAAGSAWESISMRSLASSAVRQSPRILKAPSSAAFSILRLSAGAGTGETRGWSAYVCSSRRRHRCQVGLGLGLGCKFARVQTNSGGCSEQANTDTTAVSRASCSPPRRGLPRSTCSGVSPPTSCNKLRKWWGCNNRRKQ